MNKFTIFLCTLFWFLASPAAENRSGPRLRFIEKAVKAGVGKSYKLPDFDKIPVTLIFKNSIGEEQLTILKNLDFSPQIIAGQPLGSRRVLVGFLERSLLDLEAISGIDGLLEIETTWRPQQAYPLLVSRPQIEADQVWSMLPEGATGKNILIADLDTGINHFHPLFFFADGDTFSWTDVNSNLQFDPGVDGVDLDQSGIVDIYERLRFMQINTSGAITNPTGYNPSLDWIYVDVNQNNSRDYGTQNGFTEGDPAYGEPVFITLDTDLNDELDPGEQLVMLKTSKVKKVYQSNGIIRERGIDMINNEGDWYGHGTPVNGILAGGIANIHRFSGIAPDAELLMGVNLYIPDPPFIQTMEFLAPWAANEGADVILYEDGEWIWQYMDGSSALETMIDDFSDQGIVQVVPAGNLAGGGMHTSGNVITNDSLLLSLDVVQSLGQQNIWGNFLWLGDSAGLTFKIGFPAGNWLNLPGDGQFIVSGNYRLYSQFSRSYRGTNRMDFTISAITGTLSGYFDFRLSNHTTGDIFFQAFNYDDQSGWTGASRWSTANDDGTVTWPATADKALTVAAYDPRASGEPLNSFSGRGARIDGSRLLEIAAPGSVVFSASPSTSGYGGLVPFGGTSSAGPHVAGTVALLLQLLGHPDSDLIIEAITRAADNSNITAVLPNHQWGYGRIRARAAAEVLFTPLARKTDPVIRSAELKAFPNPFNQATCLQFNPEQTGIWQIVIYNNLGQKVYQIEFPIQFSGTVSCNWNASQFGSGVYYGILYYRQEIKSVYKLIYIK
jgi:subtilisin family serine protease